MNINDKWGSINIEPTAEGEGNFDVNYTDQNGTSMTKSFTTSYTASSQQSAEICFPAGASVKTDQGFVNIEKITNQHSINGLKVLAVSKVLNKCDYLIELKKDALSKNCPNKDTLISRFHKIYHNNKGKMAIGLVNGKNIKRKKTKRDLIYNVLLEKYDKMEVNGMSVETLNPNNPIAKNILKKL